VTLTDAFDSLRAGFRGLLVMPGDAGYDAARAVWNAMVDKRPSVVARCTGPADVVTAVNFARDHGMATAVRGRRAQCRGQGNL
jgi:FAD/FMN-containing dehydrogenase